MKNKKIFITLFLSIIFISCFTIVIKTGLEYIGAYTPVKEGTWESFPPNATIFDKIKTYASNRSSNFFPFYNELTSNFRCINEDINEIMYSSFNKNIFNVGDNGSNSYIIKDTKNNAYYEISGHNNKDVENRLNKMIDFYNNMYNVNPSINLNIYIPSRIEYQGKINDIFTFRDLSVLKDNLKSNLNKNIKVGELSVDSFEEYFKYFYKSDHHWTAFGALKGYEEISNMLGIQAQKVDIVKTKYTFRGSLSRNRRNYDIKDDFYVFSNYNTDYDVLVNGEEKPDKFKPLYIDDSKVSPFADIYVEYYNGLYGDVMYDFHNNTGRNLLIISDSYSWAIDYLIANSFDKTYVVNPKYDKYEKNNFNYTEFVSQNGITDVLILQDANATVLSECMIDLTERVVF